MRGLFLFFLVFLFFPGLAQFKPETDLHKHLRGKPTVVVEVPDEVHLTVNGRPAAYLRFSESYVHHRDSVMQGKDGELLTVLRVGKEVSATYLADLMKKLREAGAENIKTEYFE